MDVVRAIEKVGSNSGETKKKVVIVDCGQIWKSYNVFVKGGDESVLRIPCSEDPKPFKHGKNEFEIGCCKFKKNRFHHFDPFVVEGGS